MTFLVRLLTFAAIFALALGTAYVVDDTDPLGLGLLVFLVYAVLGAVWGFLDGRTAPFLKVAARWLLVGVAVGATVSLGAALVEGVDDASTFWSDVIWSLPFFAVLIAVPAFVGGAIGSAVKR